MTPFESLVEFRQHLLQETQTFDTFGVFQKLFFNHTHYPTPEGLLRFLGWVHLYTASGIHIYALLSGADYFMRGFARKRQKKAIPHLPLIRLGTQACLYFMLFFLWFLQEFRFGFLRPLFTFGLRQFARNFGMRWSFLSPLLLTLLLDLLLDSNPAGRVHYYLAVGGGLLMLELVRTRNLFLAHAVMALGSWVLIALLELVTDHHVSVFTPIISLLTVPLFCGFVYPGMTIFMMLYGLTGSPLFSQAGHLSTKMLEGILTVTEYFNFTFLVAPKSAVLMAVVLAIFFTLFIKGAKGMKKRVMISLCFFLIAGGLRYGAGASLFSLVQLDVGQGDALLIKKETPLYQRAEMIDVGSARKARMEQWVSHFSKEGVTHLDGILLSHLDEDHAGSLTLLNNLVPIACVETHPRLWQTPRGMRLKQSLTVAGIRAVQAPDSCLKLIEHKWLFSGHHGKGNDLMAGSLVEVDPQTVYLAAGDADENQEREYFEKFRERISQYPKRIWKVSHHGSRFSSNPDILKKIHPDQAWVSVGKRNNYHHPHPQTIFRLEEIGIPLRRTDQQGSIRFSTSDGWR